MYPAPGLGRCVPCERVQTRGLSAVNPEVTRDVTAGAVAFTLPLGYHYLAPKKWPRTNVFGNLAAVVVLYFGTSWVVKKIQENP